MGVSRGAFYRHQELVEKGGIDNLISKSRRIPNPKNRVDEATEKAIIDYAVQPAHGQVRASNELRKAGIFVSASGGIILSDAQVAALEKKKHDDEACGEIETETVPISV